MFLLKLGSELQNLFKKFQPVLKIKRKYTLHFHEEEYFHEVESTGGGLKGELEQFTDILQSKSMFKF